MRPPKLTTEQKFQPFRHIVQDIFPTPLLRGEINLLHSSVAEDCRSLIEEIKETETDPKRYYTTYFHQEINQKLYKMSWFDSFANQVKDTYISFINGAWNRPVSHLTRHDIHLCAWASVWEKGVQHSYHNHQDSFMSGTYYPANEDGQGIKFMSPHIHTQFGYTRGGGDPFPIGQNCFAVGESSAHTEMIVKPITGETLMWPSPLLHTVEEQEGEYDRVAISFNLKHNDPITDNTAGEDISYGFLQY